MKLLGIDLARRPPPFPSSIIVETLYFDVRVPLETARLY
jgi:hypothetical protein